MAISQGDFASREERIRSYLSDLDSVARFELIEVWKKFHFGLLVSRDFPEFNLDEIEEYKTHFLRLPRYRCYHWVVDRLDVDGSGDLDTFEGWIDQKGELIFFIVQQMYESLGQTKTNLELREIIAEVDVDESGK